MLSQEKLLKVIAEDLRVCRGATHPATDTSGRDRQIIEVSTLTRHQEWAENANNDQAMLEEIVCSLEKNMVVRYRKILNLPCCGESNLALTMPTVVWRLRFTPYKFPS